MNWYVYKECVECGTDFPYTQNECTKCGGKISCIIMPPDPFITKEGFSFAEFVMIVLITLLCTILSMIFFVEKERHEWWRYIFVFFFILCFVNPIVRGLYRIISKKKYSRKKIKPNIKCTTHNYTIFSRDSGRGWPEIDDYGDEISTRKIFIFTKYCDKCGEIESHYDDQFYKK